MKYVKSKIVMLPTKDGSKIGKVKQPINHLIYNKDYINSELVENQHLHFLSNEEIKEGDWLLADGYNNMHPKHLGIAKADKEQLRAILQGFTAKKIIATTDESLNLPRPSNEFLKKYCELGGIDEVVVEYVEEYDWSLGDIAIDYPIGYKLKVAPDNTISIKSIQQKIYTQKEVDDLLKRNTAEVTSRVLNNFRLIY